MKNILLILALTASSHLLAQIDRGPVSFAIDKYTIDSGGGNSTGGDFSLTGTIGQHDASLSSSSGGEFILAGGFWANPQAPDDDMFKDSFENL